MDRGYGGLTDGPICLYVCVLGESGSELWGWFQAQQSADRRANEEFSAGEAADGVTRESEDECCVCGGLANAGPERFAWFEANAVKELCDVGAGECSRDEIEKANRNTASEEQNVGRQRLLDSSVELGGRICSGLETDDLSTHMLKESGQHGLAGVAEAAVWRRLLEGDEFISGGNDGHGGVGRN
jgi:hypothetical protein